MTYYSRTPNKILKYVISREFNFDLSPEQKNFLMKLVLTKFPVRCYSVLAKHNIFHIDELFKMIDNKHYLNAPGVGPITTNKLLKWIEYYRK